MSGIKFPERTNAYFKSLYTYHPAPKVERKISPLRTYFPVNNQPPSKSDVLGRGQYAQVRYAMRKDGTPVAVKEQTRDVHFAEIEATVLANTNHAHVVKLIDVIRPEDGSMKLVEEYLPHGIKAHMAAGGALKEKQAWAILAGAFKGVTGIHAAGYVHDDIKSANVLADKDGVVKVADPGNAKKLGEGVRKGNDWRGIYMMGAELFKYVGENELSGHAARFMDKGNDLHVNRHYSNPSKFGLQVSLLLANGLNGKTEF